MFTTRSFTLHALVASLQMSAPGDSSSEQVWIGFGIGHQMLLAGIEL